MILNIIFPNGSSNIIDFKNKNIKINDLILLIYNKYLKNNYKNISNYDIKLLHKGSILENKLSDYSILNNTDLQLTIKSKSQNIERKSIIDEYIISPFSSSLSNSYEKELDKVDVSYIFNKIKIIQNELDELKEYINNIT